MSRVSEYIWYLKSKISIQERQLEAFRNGNKYVTMQNEYEAVCRGLNNKIRKLETRLADANAQIVTVRKNWSEIFDDLDKEHKKEIAAYQAALSKMEARALRAEHKVDVLQDKLTEERRKRYEAAAQLEDAQGMIQKLTAQVNKDFQNSSIPSSQQGAGRKKIPNSREKTDRKRGGQPGHKGHRLQQRTPTESYHLPDPEEYTGNPDYYDSGYVLRRQRIILSVNVKVIEYTARVFRNRQTGSRVHAEFPEGYDTDISYDSSVKGFVFLLANEGNMSAGKIKRVLRDVSGGSLDISEATINGLCREFSQKSEPEQAQIIRDIMSSPVINADFTNANVNGESRQVFIVASPGTGAEMFIARDNKGHKGIAGTPVEGYVGTIVHDHDTTFYSYGLAHQECMQHNIRYLIGSEENEPERKWNFKMHELIKEMLHYRNGLGNDELDPATVDGFEKRYDDILLEAQKEYEDEPPGDYYREGYNLYLRLVKYKESELRFLHDKGIPSNNSLAERLARIYKRKQKQAIVFRSDKNFECLCNSLSVINTFREKEDINMYEMVADIFSRKCTNTNV